MLCRNHPDVEEGVRPCDRCGFPYCGDCLVTIEGRVYCAACKTEQVMDLRSGTANVVLPLASRLRRFAALFLDQLVFLAVIGVLLLVIVLVAAAGSGAGEEAAALFAGMAVFGMLGFFFIGYIIYEALMLRARGQTLGKMIMRIRVVREDGSALTPGQSWGRAVARTLMISILAFLNYGAAFVTAEKTCLHDMLARTRVVRLD